MISFLVHKVLVNRLGGLSLPRKREVRLTDRSDMTLDVHCGRKTTIQPTNQQCWKWPVTKCDQNHSGRPHLVRNTCICRPKNYVLATSSEYMCDRASGLGAHCLPTGEVILAVV